MARFKVTRDGYSYEKKENAFFSGKGTKKPIIMHVLAILILVVIGFIIYMSLKTCGII